MRKLDSRTGTALKLARAVCHEDLGAAQRLYDGLLVAVVLVAHVAQHADGVVEQLLTGRLCWVR